MKKMKIFSIAIMVAVLCLCTMQIAFAEAVTPDGYYQVDGMTYKLDTATNTASTYIYGTYKVDGETETYTYTTTVAEIVIPATITVPDGQYAGTYNVTKIGEYTFGAPSGKARGQSETTENETTTSITLPEGITGIGKYAFNGFKEMSALVIPSTVTTIEAYAFTGSSGLKTIDLKNTAITAIPDRCFNNCYNLSKLELPSTVTSIHMNAFKNTRHIQTIRINSEEVTLTAADKNYGFPAAFGLVPDSIADNGSAETPTVFYVKTEAIRERLIELAEKDVVSGKKTYDLSGIRDGSQIKLFFDPITIDNVIYSQYNDDATEAIITGNTIEKLSELNLVIPSKFTVSGREITVKAVGAQAFCYLDASAKPATDGKTINSIVLPETVTSIGKEAFYRHNYMEKFVAKGNIELTDADDGIFKGCSSLEEIDFAGINMLTAEMFHTCKSLESIVIPSAESITIFKSAFDRTISLYKGKLKDVYLNASEIILEDVTTSEDAMKAGEISFHVPTANAKAALTEYGIADANVIVGKKLYLLDNSLGTYAVASEAMPEGKIIVATYKGDELVNVDEIKDANFGVGYNAIETSLEVSRGITRKIFVWSDLTSMIPLGAMIN